MEDVVVRPRYNRNQNSYYKRKRKSLKSNNTLAEIIVRQTVISLAILIFIGLIKSLDTAPTNYITGKIKSTLAYNMEMKKIYQGMDKLIKKAEKIVPDKKSSNNGRKDGAGAGTVNLDKDNTDKNEVSSDITDNPINSLNAEEVDNTALADQIANNAANESLIKEIKAKFVFTQPVKGFLSSPYGNRISPIKKTMAFHQGVDIGADAGTTIVAAVAGEVIEAGSDPVYGNYIKLKHEDGLETLYAHCSELIAKKGNKVSRGTSIAKVGNTGLSVGAHLHFEIRKDGKTLDPAKFIDIPLKT